MFCWRKRARPKAWSGQAPEASLASPPTAGCGPSRLVPDRPPSRTRIGPNRDGYEYRIRPASDPGRRITGQARQEAGRFPFVGCLSGTGQHRLPGSVTQKGGNEFSSTFGGVRPATLRPTWHERGAMRCTVLDRSPAANDNGRNPVLVGVDKPVGRRRTGSRTDRRCGGLVFATAGGLQAPKGTSQQPQRGNWGILATFGKATAVPSATPPTASCYPRSPTYGEAGRHSRRGDRLRFRHQMPRNSATEPP